MLRVLNSSGNNVGYISAGTAQSYFKVDKMGFGSTGDDPDNQLVLNDETPIMVLVDSGVNTDYSTAAQEIDSACVVFDASSTEPDIYRKTSAGKTIETLNVYEGWCTHEAATDTITLGALPADAMVTEVYVWVQEAFDSDGDDFLYVGYDGDSDAYGTELDVSSTGVKAMTLGATSKTVDGTGRTLKVYYNDGGSDAANGEVHVAVKWFRATTNPS